MNNEFAKTKTIGHVYITDSNTGEVLLDKNNAIHPQNLARVFARGLANETNQQVYKVVLGNGGTHIDAGGNITYMTPNTAGVDATIYNETYSEVVDDASAQVGAGNSVLSAPAPDPSIASIVTVTIELTANEPVGQAASDGITTDPDSTFTFDELGLATADDPDLLLSHIVFSPIEKTANRSILITYTLTIVAS